MISAVNNNYSTPSFGCIHKPKKSVSKKQVLAGAATVAAITAGVVYRKPIMKFFKEFSLKKVSNLFKKDDAPAGYSKLYRNARRDALAKTMENYNPKTVVEDLKSGKQLSDLGITSRKEFYPYA